MSRRRWRRCGGLALEWPEDLAPTAAAFLSGGRLADHPLLWSGDGRITALAFAYLPNQLQDVNPDPRDLVLTAATRSAQRAS